ncbi:MAG: LacI family transcriptional regulator [Chloroflexota bacterium]
MASIKDVAKEAGVSTATVSRVLSNKPHVRAEVRERVLIAIKNLDYRPNLVARNLRTRRSNIIGLIVADIRNPYFTSVSRAVEDSAYEHGYSVFLCNTDENRKKEEIYINLMRDENVAGVIFAPTQKTAKEIHSLYLNFPTVIIDRGIKITEDSAMDLVLIDNVDAAYRLTKQLLEKGKKRIAGIFGKHSYTGKQRQEGFKKALSEFGLDYSTQYARFVSPKISAGKTAAENLLRLSKPPDAIFTTNSLLTAGAMSAVLEKGLIIPNEIAIVGFDNPTWTSIVQPPVTVISQPTEEIGRIAIDLLHQRIKNPKLPAREVILQGKLIKRGSV